MELYFEVVEEITKNTVAEITPLIAPCGVVVRFQPPVVSFLIEDNTYKYSCSIAGGHNHGRLDTANVPEELILVFLLLCRMKVLFLVTEAGTIIEIDRYITDLSWISDSYPDTTNLIRLLSKAGLTMDISHLSPESCIC